MRKLNLLDNIVRKRIVFFVTVVAVAFVCAFLIPRTNINSDMTRYLPNDSPMKQGIAQMAEEFGENEVGTGMVRVMFISLPDSLRTTTQEDLSDTEGVSSVLYQPGSEEYNRDEKVLYELLCSIQRSQQEIADEISNKYGNQVIVETSENITTAPLGVILIAFALLLLVLIIMCESWLEPPLFLAAIGVAVAINMGTNALFESVSSTTNSIAAILQLVLSIDYSIILMNRYRQEKSLGNSDKTTAMTNALKKASSSIVSSAFTTIVGLMALVFMKLKIGADMGIVLAKGVLCSLVAVFTVLPTLILALDTAIAKSTKKVLIFRTDRLAGFSLKYRIPLAIVFVAIFANAYYFHKKTEISFVLEQKSEIAKFFPQKNIIVLLYNNTDAPKIIELADTLKSNKHVKSIVSYPSLMQKQLTATEAKSMIGDFPAVDINTVVDAIFYLGSRNPSDERMSLHDFALLAKEQSRDSTLSTQYIDMLVSLTDTSLIDRKLTSAEISDIIGIDQELIAILCPENQKISIREIVKTSRELLTESIIPAPAINHEPEPQFVELQEEPAIENDSLETTETIVPDESMEVVDDKDLIYKDSTIFLSQHTASEIAQLIGMDEKSASIIFNLYRRNNKQKAKTMSLFDFIHFINSDISQRKIFASRIDEESRKLLRNKENMMLAALQPNETESPEEEPAIVTQEEPTENIVETAVVEEEPEPAYAMPTVDKENLEKLDKAEKIMAIATKGNWFDAAGMHKLLHSLGADVKMQDIELAYLYHGITHFDNDNVKMSAEEMLRTLNDSVIANPRFSSIVNEEIRSGVDKVNALIDENFSKLRGSHYSQAIVFTDLPKESDETSCFVEALAAQCDNQLKSSHFLIGESVMMEEMRNQFGDEMLLVTLITILSVFLIVAITFRSLAVPTILVMTVMSAVYINVALSGLNGSTLLYLAYLIMQSILMGATIDYGILFTNNYREARASMSKIDSIRQAYKSSTYTILTSGMIMTLAPFVMSLLMDDATISMITRSIAAGALAAVLLIIFVLPGLLATFDKFVIKKKRE